ncbi:MAG: carboxypeptidase regulatory-like domain-containing protein [Terriglobales bacterium]
MGANQQNVTVSAEGELLQTESATIGNTTDQTTVTALPLTSRNFTQILQLNPGTASALPNAATVGKGTVDFNVNGTRMMDNNYQIDGEDAMDLETGSSAGIVAEAGISIPDPDAIEEFRVQTGNYDATYGRAAGASVDVVTKSGTNQFHGDAFEFLRNTVFDANDFFLNSAGRPRPVLRQNQFGGTFGGPLIRDKVFIFTSYQGTLQTNGEGNTSLQSVKLPLFSATASGRTAAALGQEFAGLKGLQGGVAVAPDGSNINPVALALLNAKLPNGQYLIPAPQIIQNPSNVTTGGFSAYSQPSTFKETQLLGNLDWTPTSNQRLTEKYFWSKDTTFSAFSTSDLPGAPTDNANSNVNLSLRYTYIYSPTFINQVSTGYHRIYDNLSSEYPVTNAQIGMTPSCSSMPVSPIISVAGTFSVGGTFNDGQWLNLESYEAGDQMTWVHGTHNMKFGTDFESTNEPLADPETTRGTIGFSSVPDFLLGMSAAQNGSSAGFSNLSNARSLCGDAQKEFHEADYDAYYQDDWHATKNLTLNLGLRWDAYGQVSDKLGKFVAFWPQLATNNFPSSGNLFTGFIVPANYVSAFGAPPAGVAVNSNNTFAGNPVSYRNVGPRLGFSWNARPKVVIRGGWGLYYGRTATNDAYQFVGDEPFEISQSNSGTLAAAATFQNPWTPSAPEQAGSYPNFLPRTQTSQLTLNLPGPEWIPPTVQQYNLTTQYAVSNNTVIQIGYVGNKSTHDQGGQNVDQALLTVNPAAAGASTFTGPTTAAANLQARRPILGFSSLSLAKFFLVANYNALQATVQHRMSHGMQFQLAYTYSKTLTDDTGDGTFAGGQGGISGDNSSPMNGYGPASYETPQRLVGNFVWQLPFSQRGLRGAVLGGWGVSGVVTLQSGTPLNFSDSLYPNIYGGSGRAQMCPNSNYSDIVVPGPIESKLNRYFNINAVNCAPPAIGNGFSWGNTGTGIVLGPGERSADFTLSREFKAPGPSETNTLQFRAEFYNAFNFRNFSNPGTSASSSSFGQITSTTVAPRLVQFALKYLF